MLILIERTECGGEGPLLLLLVHFQELVGVIAWPLPSQSPDLPALLRPRVEWGVCLGEGGFVMMLLSLSSLFTGCKACGTGRLHEASHLLRGQRKQVVAASLAGSGRLTDSFSRTTQLGTGNTKMGGQTAQLQGLGALCESTPADQLEGVNMCPLHHCDMVSLTISCKKCIRGTLLSWMEELGNGVYRWDTRGCC